MSGTSMILEFREICGGTVGSVKKSGLSEKFVAK